MKKFFSTYKKIIACLVIGAVLGFGSTTNSYVTAEEYNKLLAQQEEVKSQIVSLEDTIKKEHNSVALLNEQKVAKEESIKVELEAEKARIEKENVDKEAVDKAAKEAAERVAKEEIKSSTSSVSTTQESSKKSSNSGNSSTKSNDSVSNEEAIGELVWQSATGKKYHRISNCGNMNPNKARQITKNEAKSIGLGACKKCY